MLEVGATLQWTSIPSRGVEIPIVASCYTNWDNLRPDEPLLSYADLTLPPGWHFDAKAAQQSKKSGPVIPRF